MDGADMVEQEIGEDMVEQEIGEDMVDMEDMEDTDGETDTLGSHKQLNKLKQLKEKLSNKYLLLILLQLLLMPLEEAELPKKILEDHNFQLVLTDGVDIHIEDGLLQPELFQHILQLLTQSLF